MPERSLSTKQKGNLALASAIQHFVAQGYVVSIPLSKSAKYDLVVELDGKLSRVQCKYAGNGRRMGLYLVPLDVSSGNRSAGNRRIKDEALDFDLTYGLCESGGT